MNLQLENPVRASETNPLALAFLGDAVFELLARSELVALGNARVNELHRAASLQTRAAAQAKSAKKISPLLTEDELAVFKRGRNARTGGIPKSATSAEYHYATGLEALFGWLYLNGKTERINGLYGEIRRET